MKSIYEKALIEIGSNNRYQKRFDVIYNVILVVLWAMVYMNIVLALVIMPHHCKLPEKPKNITLSQWKSKHIPLLSDSNENFSFSSCLIYANKDKNNDTQECQEYEYDTTWYGTTVASSNNWVCDKEIYVANVFAYIKIGELVGSLLFGWIGDVYGRRPPYIISMILTVTGRFISIVGGHSYILFVTGCIIASLPSWSIAQSTTVISLEISSPGRRTLIATLRFVSYSAGLCIMAMLYWWLRDWKLFLMITSSMLLPYLFMSWKMIESPQWLWTEGKTDACIKVLKNIAKVNKTKLEENTENDFVLAPPIIKPQTMGTLNLFAGWQLFWITILQLLLWVCTSLSYTVLLLRSGEKTDGNPFIEFGLQAAVEVPGHITGAWLSDHLGRRHAGIISYIMTALVWLLMIFRDSGISLLSAWWIGTILSTFGRLSVTITYYIINLLNMELYPTCVRQSGMALGNVFSSGASAIAPYLLYVGRTKDSTLPNVILTGVALIGIISSFLLPETLNTKLPETLQEVRQLWDEKYKKYRSVRVTLEEDPSNVKLSAIEN